MTPHHSWLEGLRWQARDPWEGIRAHATATFDQASWRFRNDDGDQAAATWKAAERVAVSGQAIGQNFRLRYEIQETGGSSEERSPLLQFSLDNGTTWQGDSFDMDSASTSPVRMAQSPHVLATDPTTDQLVIGTGTYVAGEIFEDFSNGGNAVMFPALGHTEWEWVLELNPNYAWADGDTVLFRVLLAIPGGTYVVTDTNTAGYANLTVSATVAPPAQVTGLHSTGRTRTTVDLAWDPAANTDSYEVEMDGTVIGSVVGTTAQVQNLQPETTYTFRVRATNTGGAGPYSDPLSVTTLGFVESLTIAASSSISAADTATTSEAVTALAVASTSGSDQLYSPSIRNIAVAATVLATDAITLSETRLVSATASTSTTDSLTTSEGLTVLATATMAALDSTSTSETRLVSATASTSASDGAAASEGLTVLVVTTATSAESSSTQENLATLGTVTLAATAAASATEHPGLTATVAVTVPAAAKAAENLGVSATAAVTASDTWTSAKAVENLEVSATAAVTVSDSGPVVEPHVDMDTVQVEAVPDTVRVEASLDRVYLVWVPDRLRVGWGPDTCRVTVDHIEQAWERLDEVRALEPDRVLVGAGVGVVRVEDVLDGLEVADYPDWVRAEHYVDAVRVAAAMDVVAFEVAPDLV